MVLGKKLAIFDWEWGPWRWGKSPEFLHCSDKKENAVCCIFGGALRAI